MIIKKVMITLFSLSIATIIVGFILLDMTVIRIGTASVALPSILHLVRLWHEHKKKKSAQDGDSNELPSKPK